MSSRWVMVSANYGFITVQATGFISSNVAMLWSFCCAGVTSVPKVATSKTQNALQANGKMEVKNE